nr:hypothetical protein [Leucobacter muris]
MPRRIFTTPNEAPAIPAAPTTEPTTIAAVRPPAPCSDSSRSAAASTAPSQSLSRSSGRISSSIRPTCASLSGPPSRAEMKYCRPSVDTASRYCDSPSPFRSAVWFAHAMRSAGSVNSSTKTT